MMGVHFIVSLRRLPRGKPYINPVQRTTPVACQRWPRPDHRHGSISHSITQLDKRGIRNTITVELAMGA